VSVRAAEGVGAGYGSPIPFFGEIQESFGRHDVGEIEAHVGGAAGEAAGDIGAEAYATGTHVAFARPPDLHTTAHEAAHVVQQRGGIDLEEGLGRQGDAYERHADAVADRVVKGASAEALLDEVATPGRSGGARTGAVQPKTEGKSQSPPARSGDGEGEGTEGAGDAVEAQLCAALEASVADGDDRAIQARKRRIVSLIRGLSLAQRAALLERLYTPGRGDRLADLFQQRLASATRRSLLAVLREAPEPGETEGAAAASGEAGVVAARPGAGESEDDTWRAVLGEASAPVGKLGRVEAPKGLRLLASPSATAQTITIIPFDTLVHVERRTDHGWYYVVAMGGAHAGPSVTGAGCVEGQFVELDPPEPTAHLHHVKPGEMLKDIAAQHYKPRRGFDWGADAHLYVEAIWEANKSTGKLLRVGGDLSWSEKASRTEQQEKTLAIWRSVQPKANHAIWIPSQAFVSALEGQGLITSGSISHGAWQAAKGAAEALVEFATYRAGFHIGVLEGAFAAARDLVMGVIDLASMVYDLVKSLIGEGLVGTAQSIGEKLVDLFRKAPALLQQAGAWFVGKWTQEDDFDRGEFHGEVIGYIVLQVLLAIVTAGESVALQATGRFATFIKVIRGLDAAGDILTVARGAARAANLPAKAASRLRNAAGGAGDAAETAADAAETAANAAGDATRHARGDRGLSGRDAPSQEAPPAGGARRTKAQRDALVAGLPPELRGDVGIVESDAIMGAGVHVVYKDGDLRIEVGPDAEPRHVRYHADTARHLLKFQGPLGSVRRLLDAILTKLKLTPGFGTKGFEANLEVKKLLAIKKELEQLHTHLDGRVRQLSDDLSSIDARQVQRELAEIHEQFELHRRSVDSYEPGRGFVAAEGRGRGLPEFPIARSTLFELLEEEGHTLKLTYYGKSHGGEEVWLGHGKVVLDDEGLPRSFPDFTLDATTRIDNQSHAVHIYDDVEVDPAASPGGTSPVRGRGERLSVTRYAIGKFLDMYSRRFGHAPDALQGLLEWSNKLNFQREFFRLKQAGLSDADAATGAVREIPFGKNRIPFGYDEFEVRVTGKERVNLGKPFGREQVPARIFVIARKRGATLDEP
jgi:hypothetical protein